MHGMCINSITDRVSNMCHQADPNVEGTVQASLTTFGLKPNY